MPREGQTRGLHTRTVTVLARGAQRAYWRRQLAGAPALLELPTDHARPPLPSGAGGAITFTLPAALTRRLRYLAAGTNASMFMVMVAAWQARCLSSSSLARLRRWLHDHGIGLGRPPE